MLKRPLTRVVRALAAGDVAGLSDRDLLARFVADGDQAAFAAVAVRHTGLVLGVCRRALPRSIDAEDACQAVFLLLAEKAGRIRWQGSVAGWLYTVARRVARNARVAAERRARRESRAAVPESVSPTDTMTGRELAAILDEELGRLPPRYRDPLVLCCLEGLTQDEAAGRLGVPVETLRSQLKRGRKKLAGVLAARGVELGIALLAVTASAVGAASPHLAKRIQAAATGSPSRAAIELVRGATGNSLLANVKTVMLAAAVGAAALALGAALNPPTSAEPPKDPPKPAAVTVETPVLARFGSTRFRADEPLSDARFSADGKHIVGCTGGRLYVWNAVDGSLTRTIDTGLRPFDNPTRSEERQVVVALHPKEPRVAIGGDRDGKAILQVWDFEAGKRLAELASPYAALKLIAWTPDGTRLLERTNDRWEKSKVGKLIVRDAALNEVRNHDLPANFGDWSTLMLPLPGGAEVILWQSQRQPTVFDLGTGREARTIPFTVSLPTGLGVSPDGKRLAVTGTNELALLDAKTGDVVHNLPVLRDGWYKPRPMFSPDGKTAYFWDHRPIAYDVATGKEKWRGLFRSVHTVTMHLSDVSPDGSTLLCWHGLRVARLDAATGKELDPSDDPSKPAGLTWSPDGRMLFTRAERHERTWTAWDAATGKRLFDLQPGSLAADENWKMQPDLFFINNGKEIVVGIEKSESTEQSAAKDLLVFDAATGKPLHRLGAPLPTEQFRWCYPVAVAPDGSEVAMQVYAISSATPGPGGLMQLDYVNENTFKTFRWDAVKGKVLGEWEVVGDRCEPARLYGPYTVTAGTQLPDPNVRDPKLRPAKVRCYSLTDGKLMHEWTTGFSGLEPDRVQGNFLLTTGYDSKWVTSGNTMRYVPQRPIAYDLWELPSRQAIRLFEQDKQTTTILGPAGRYVLRIKDDRTVEVIEPFVLKSAVATVAVSAGPVYFEFSPDGGRLAVSLSDTLVVIWDTTPWRAEIDKRLAKEIPTDLGPLWDDLSGDAVKGLRAARLLSVAVDKAVNLLKAKVTARPAPDAERVKQLVADLDSPKFAAREKAEGELRDLSVQAEPFLKKARQASPSAEAAKRIDSLLNEIATHKLSPAELREVRAVQALQWMGTPAARALLDQWAKGDPAASRTRAAKAESQSSHPSQ
jgi:RNA polymerase sigma factor (sigma-70 family)